MGPIHFNNNNKINRTIFNFPSTQIPLIYKYIQYLCIYYMFQAVIWKSKENIQVYTAKSRDQLFAGIKVKKKILTENFF